MFFVDRNSDRLKVYRCKGVPDMLLVNSDRRQNVSQTSTLFNKASTFGQLLDALRREADRMGIWNDEMQRDLPKRWEKHGNMIILPQNCFKHPNWRQMGPKLWQMVTELLNANRLGKKRFIEGDDFHGPHIDLLHGKDGWVEHIDGDIRFFYEVTKCFFNVDNASEKQRISQFDCHQEVVTDMFAGIGYYTLPYLISAHAKHVYAIDWNEDAIEALQRGLQNNGVQDRCTVIHGDARKVAPQGIADRVNLGLIPSSRPYWLAACKCLKATGGILHIHEAVSISAQDIGSLELPNGAAAHPKLIGKENAKSLREKTLASDTTDSKNIDAENRISLKNVDKNEGAFFSKSMDNSDMQCEETNTAMYKKTMKKRKLSRSATIIKEMESRILPNGRIDERLREEKWSTINQILQNFAMICATNCTRYLNNIHDEKDKVWTCTILGVNTVKSYPKQIDHIVVDLLCRPEDEKEIKSIELQAQADYN
uniref:tRNA(Phe) (4-demethylwyosine(37)-C(7)) aminocarboxypropyltransferase n=1 Tax=Setaria digitata TaxID=48799 RepID=A0A915PS11_9BILA